jgi:PhoH-like ATPase
MAGKKKTVTVVKPDIPEDLSEHPFYGIELDDEQKMMANTIWNPNIDIIFVNSKSGCGKTFVATGVANLLVQYGLYDSIVYIMSPYGERKQGWLPGTITEKSSVYFEAFYQALISCNVNPHTAINDDSMVNQKNGTGYITCITDTFLRGSNLDNAVIILDEAQNYTVSQLKKTLTRVGKKAKVIVIGHDLQCDLEKPEQSGFLKYIEHFKGKERAAVCTLTTNHRSWISQWADEVRE